MAVLAITFVGILQVAAAFAAYQLGRMQATPKSKWEKGTFLEGGWAAWRTPYIIILALGVAVTVFLPILNATGFGRGFFSSFGMGQRRPMMMQRPGYGYQQQSPW